MKVIIEGKKGREVYEMSGGYLKDMARYFDPETMTYEIMFKIAGVGGYVKKESALPEGEVISKSQEAGGAQ